MTRRPTYESSALRWSRGRKHALDLPRPWRWMLFRWCYVQLDQRHKGVDAFEPTRRHARQAVSEILRVFGGSLAARAPKSITEDPQWIETLQIVGAIGDHEARLALACWLMELEVADRTRADQKTVARWLVAMRSLACSMTLESEACAAGWTSTDGWPGVKKRRRRRTRR